MRARLELPVIPSSSKWSVTRVENQRNNLLERQGSFLPKWLYPKPPHCDKYHYFFVGSIHACVK